MKVHIVETQRPGPLLEELVYYFQESLVKLEGNFLHYKSRSLKQLDVNKQITFIDEYLTGRNLLGSLKVSLLKQMKDRLVCLC